MSFQVLGCPNCQQPFQVAAEQAGQVVQCPSCAQAVEIPANAFEVRPTPPPLDQQVYACPVCSGQFGVTADMFGQQVGCPHCQAYVLIQAPGAQVDPPEPEAEAGPLIDTSTPASRRRKNKKIVLDAPAAPPPNHGIQSTVAPPERAHPVEALAADEPVAMTDRRNELMEAGQDPIDHLLPPRFDVLDPSRLRMDMGTGQFKVLLPDGKGGTTQFDQRVMHVEHGGHQVPLISLSPKQRARRRLIQNIIAIVIGIIIIAIAFTILR